MLINIQFYWHIEVISPVCYLSLVKIYVYDLLLVYTYKYICFRVIVVYLILF